MLKTFYLHIFHKGWPKLTRVQAMAKRFHCKDLIFRVNRVYREFVPSLYLIHCFFPHSFKGCISGITYSNGRSPLREARLKEASGTTQGCLDPCSQPDHCLNGGKCHKNVSGVWCDCKGTGYEGQKCEEGRYQSSPV